MSHIDYRWELRAPTEFDNYPFGTVWIHEESINEHDPELTECYWYLQISPLADVVFWQEMHREPIGIHRTVIKLSQDRSDA